MMKYFRATRDVVLTFTAAEAPDGRDRGNIFPREYNDKCIAKWNYQYEQKEAHPNVKIDAHCIRNRGKYTYIAKGQEVLLQ